MARPIRLKLCRMVEGMGENVFAKRFFLYTFFCGVVINWGTVLELILYYKMITTFRHVFMMTYDAYGLGDDRA